MSLGVKQKKTYLNIKDGKIALKKPNGETALYDSIEGSLVGITKLPREFKGEPVTYWYFDIAEPGGETYSLGLHYNSGVAKAILNSLASAETLGRIKIETYLKNEFTKTSVYNNGERLSWKYAELPPLEILEVGGKIIKDDSKRMRFFEGIAEEIINKVNPVNKVNN
jgi:hypothetical protein